MEVEKGSGTEHVVVRVCFVEYLAVEIWIEIESPYLVALGLLPMHDFLSAPSGSANN